MAHPSAWRQERRGSWSDDDGPVPGQKPDPGTRRPYSPVAETLFRKDLISAMKLPDNEPLEADDYWQVQDTWKQEWERGVQVPVKPNGLPEPHVSALVASCKSERFTLPKKLICMNTSGSYKPETHQVTPMVLRAEQVCTYDLDNVDKSWLEALNGERALGGLNTVTETEMERTVEELEKQCREKINSSLRSCEDFDIAQDDSIICDVCRSPDSEESNEMVFCDQCNICVHQACYGITTIPSGPWLCRTCTLGIKPPCELCPNKGGAMKSTRTGSKWAHVSCALWIPEVSIGDVEKMEPITKISCIPPSRWSLKCVLCKESNGSCIQCSVKTCKTAYHVTCAFKYNLEMRAIIEDEQAEDGVKLRSYCQKHSLNCKKKSSEDSDSEKNMTPEEKNQARRQKMAKVEREFYKLVDVTIASTSIGVNEDVVEVISKFWMLKRRAGGNKPLVVSRGDDEPLSSMKGEDTERDRMKMLVNIRQDLERVRNLAYMVSRREKLSRSYVKLREQVLEKQLALLADEDSQNQMSLIEMSAVLEANHGPTIYDKIFSNPDSEQHTHEDFEMLICRIAGEISEGSAQIRKDNPFRKKSTDLKANSISRTVPYERIFSDTSQSESDDSFIKMSTSSHQTSLDKKKKKESPDSKNKMLLKKMMRSDSSMSSSEEELALKNLSPHKNKSSILKKNIYSDSESEIEKTPRGRGRGRPPKKQNPKEFKQRKKTESSSEALRLDSEDTQNSSDIRPKEVRTKAAMKAFNYEDFALAKKIMEEKSKDAVKRIYDSDDDSLMEVDVDNNAFLLKGNAFVSQRKAAKKAEKKLSKSDKAAPNDDKKKGTKASELFGTSDDESSLSRLTDNLRNKPRCRDDLLKSPRKSSEHKKKHTSTDSESSDDDQLLPTSSHNKNKLLSPPKKEKYLSEKCLSKLPKKFLRKKRDPSPEEDNIDQKKESQITMDFDDLFDNSQGSDSESESEKKKLFDDFEHPEVYTDFVPQRRAAMKASAQLSEQNVWKKTQQELYMAELVKQQKQKEAAVKKKSKRDKKESSDSDALNNRKSQSMPSSSSVSSSSSDSEAESDRRKSPRGRGKSPKGNSTKIKPSKDLKNLIKRPTGPRKPRKKGGDGEGKISSSKALEYLMQRESQLSNILGDYKKEEEPESGSQSHAEARSVQITPDKKLKTSEGRPDQIQSPPKSPKDSSDSESDSSSNDSVILGIQARLQKDLENDEKFLDDDDDHRTPTIPTVSMASNRCSMSSSKEDYRESDSRSRDCHDISVERPTGTGSGSEPISRGQGEPKSPSSACEQLKHQPSITSTDSLGQKKSIFSPDRSPRTTSDQSRSQGQVNPSSGREHGPTSEKEMLSPGCDWKSPREWKWAETGQNNSNLSTGSGAREISATQTKSTALNRSLEGSRSSPLQQQHRSPGFGRSPARHAQHPLNKSLDLNKSSDSFTNNKNNVFPENNNKKSEESCGRKLSVESKDSDGDSAKSSLADGTSTNGLPEPDFSKEDSTDTLYSGDKLGSDSSKPKNEQVPTINKKDEGYVSAEKDQNDNAQDNVVKQRDGLSALVDKISPNKGFKRLSTEEPVIGQDQFPSKANNSWPEIFAQQQQQQFLEEQQQRSRQQQKHDISNNFDGLVTGKDSRQDGSKNVVDAFASSQQQQFEALINLQNQIQYNNHQRKPGERHDLSQQQQQMAYMQQYMKDLGGSSLPAQYLQAYQMQYLQQMQQAFGIKSQGPDQEFLMLMQAQAAQQAAQISQEQMYYQERLREQEQRKHDEKRIMEERRKQEEKRLQEEKKRLDEKRRKEELFRQEELKRQEEQRLQQEQKRRLDEEKRLEEEKQKKEEEERKRKEEEQRKIREENIRKQEEARQQEKQRMLEQTRKLEEQRLEQENLRMEEFQRFQGIRNQGFGPEFLHQNFANPYNLQHPANNTRGIVSHVEDQLGALLGKSNNQDQPRDSFKKGSASPNRTRPVSPKVVEKKIGIKVDQDLNNKIYPVPSATPADQLPGWLPSRDRQRPSHDSHHDVKGRDTPQSIAGSDVSHNSAPSGIPNELLDSVLETAKLPVWKPPDGGDQQQPVGPGPVIAQAGSPAKIISTQSSLSRSPTKPAPVNTEHSDSSFDDLVRHIDSSPSSNVVSSIQQQNKLSSKLSNQNDQTSASEAERSDYDNDQLSMGGVDYDDPDEDYPRKLPQKKVPCYKDNDQGNKSVETRETRRGTKVPCYTEKTEEEFDVAVKPPPFKAVPALLKQANNKPPRNRTGKLFGGKKGLKIDQKAIEKVHKNLAGTDFDFEDEFDDDFGSSPKPEIKSLKGFRDQTKKAPIYMKETEQIPPVPDFDEEPLFEDRSFNTANKNRGRRTDDSPDTSDVCRDEPMEKEVPKVKISLKKQLKNRAEEEVEEILEKVEKSKPKIPTLKIKIGGRTESPVSIESDEAEKDKQKKRRGSLEKLKGRSEEKVSSIESEEATNQQRVPKLKIKIGAPKSDPECKDDSNLHEELEDDQTSTFTRSGTTPTSSPARLKRTPTQNSKPGTPATERLDLDTIRVKSSPKTVSSLTSSPTNSKNKDTFSCSSKLDLCDNSSDLQKIFGSGEPLPVVIGESQQKMIDEKSEEEPSELELLALELAGQLEKEKKMKEAEAAKREKDGNTFSKKKDFDDDEVILGNSMHHDPKYKFKQLNKPSGFGDGSNGIQTTTPLKLNFAQTSAAAAAGDSNPLRRMRKKELLNQYYGIETVPTPLPTPAPSCNGPTATSSTFLDTKHSIQASNSHSREPPVRMGIKMPKAVASVTSVPTRADYQQQLEVQLERKRKREGKDPDYKKGKSSKGGKGSKKNEEEQYKPKIKMSVEDHVEANKEMRKTRGKPPKKCLAVDDSPERDPYESFITSRKKESMKFAEDVLASFDKDEDRPERRRKERKKRRRDVEDSLSQPKEKTPRIVIKFSKNKDQPSRNIPADNNGLIKPVQKESPETHQNIPKLKIKKILEPTLT